MVEKCETKSGLGSMERVKKIKFNTLVDIHEFMALKLKKAHMRSTRVRVAQGVYCEGFGSTLWHQSAAGEVVEDTVVARGQPLLAPLGTGGVISCGGL